MRFDDRPPEPLASAPGFLLSWNGQRMAMRFADALEQMGFAERRQHPDDRRKHAVHLTAKGRRTLERARTVAIETAGETFAPLDANEIETLRLLLRKLAGAG
jgi:DNA-binding MarR family transcriptional regulator